MANLTCLIKMCDDVVPLSDSEKDWIDMPSVGMEVLKARPMLVKESDDPCVYDTATGEFVFVNKEMKHGSKD